MNATLPRALAAACFAIAAFGSATSAWADDPAPAATTKRPWAPMYRAEPEEATAEPPGPPPRLIELGVAPALEFGRGVMVAPVVSPTLTVRTWEAWRLGASFTPMIGRPLQGFEGCSTLRYCVQSSYRVAARAEYQVNGSGSARPWAAVELGLESWTGMDMVKGAERQSGLSPIFSAQGGVDAVTRGSSSLGGVGVFGGIVLGHLGMGFQVGLRVAFASF